MKLEDLLLHPKTRQAVEQTLHSGAHAIVLAGPAGSGKLTLARAIAARTLGIVPDRLAVAPYFSQIEPLASLITIDQVRELQRFLRLKTTGTATVRRVALLVRADTMNAQAQNALLKTLEEPPLDTLLVLTVADAEGLLDTVRSRVRTIQVLPPNQDMVMERFAAAGTAPEAITRAYAMSGGHMGLVSSLLNGDASANAAAGIEQAKQLLGMKPFERLVQVEALAKDKDQISAVLTGLKRVCRGALRHAAQHAQDSHVSAWHRRLTAVDESESLHARGANAKLLLTDLFLNL